MKSRFSKFFVLLHSNVSSTKFTPNGLHTLSKQPNKIATDTLLWDLQYKMNRK